MGRYEDSSQSLLPSDVLHDNPSSTVHTKAKWRRALFFTALSTSIMLNVVQFLAQWLQIPNHYYSPVSHLATRHPRLFTTGLGRDKTIYQESPSAEKYDAWRALYVHAVRIPKSIAARLPNKTIAVPASSGVDDSHDYIVGINVFHHLHCLHLLSQALDFTFHPAYYGLNATYNHFDQVHSLEDINQSLEEAFLQEEHMGHCVDSLRQALMCEADLSTYVWQTPSETGGESTGTGPIRNQLHPQTFVNTQKMCVDFDAIRRWAGERRYEQALPTVIDNGFPQGRCGYNEPGCGDDIYGEQDWRRRNNWKSSTQWNDYRQGEGDGATSIFFEKESDR